MLGPWLHVGGRKKESTLIYFSVTRFIFEVLAFLFQGLGAPNASILEPFLSHFGGPGTSRRASGGQLGPGVARIN